MSGIDPVNPPGEPAPELLDGRIWVDGCWDFFHHGPSSQLLLYLAFLSSSVSALNLPCHVPVFGRPSRLI